jgi:hypothetical protein
MLYDSSAGAAPTASGAIPYAGRTSNDMDSIDNPYGWHLVMTAYRRYRIE